MLEPSVVDRDGDETDCRARSAGGGALSPECQCHGEALKTPPVNLQHHSRFREEMPHLNGLMRNESVTCNDD